MGIHYTGRRREWWKNKPLGIIILLLRSSLGSISGRAGQLVRALKIQAMTKEESDTATQTPGPS